MGPCFRASACTHLFEPKNRLLINDLVGSRRRNSASRLQQKCVVSLRSWTKSLKRFQNMCAWTSAKAGTHNHKCQLLGDAGTTSPFNKVRRGVWFPAFAGTTGWRSCRFTPRFRNNGIVPVSCPTCQVAWSDAGHRHLLCMGLFSIFWQRASRASGRGEEDHSSRSIRCGSSGMSAGGIG